MTYVKSLICSLFICLISQQAFSAPSNFNSPLNYTKSLVLDGFTMLCRGYNTMMRLRFLTDRKKCEIQGLAIVPV